MHEKSQAGVAFSESYNEYQSTFRWFNFQGLGLEGGGGDAVVDGGAVGGSVVGNLSGGVNGSVTGSDAAGGSRRRQRRQRRLGDEPATSTEAEARAVGTGGISGTSGTTAAGTSVAGTSGVAGTSVADTATAVKRQERSNIVGRGLLSFCKTAGIKPDMLFLSTLVLFTALVGASLVFFVLLVLFTHFVVLRGKQGLNQRFVHVLRWRMQGLVLKACFYGFYAISSSAMFQVFLQFAEPAVTMNRSSTLSQNGTTATALVSLTLFSLIIFGGCSWVLAKSESKEQVEITIGALVIKYKPSHRFFWAVRPAQILVIGIVMGTMGAHPHAQIGALAAMHFLSLVAVVVVKPFKDVSYGVVASVVEALRFVCICLMFVIIDQPSSAIEVTTVALNTLALFLLGGVEVCELFAGWRRRRREAKEAKGGGGEGEYAGEGGGCSIDDDQSRLHKTPQHLEMAWNAASSQLGAAAGSSTRHATRNTQNTTRQASRQASTAWDIARLASSNKSVDVESHSSGGSEGTGISGMSATAGHSSGGGGARGQTSSAAASTDGRPWWDDHGVNNPLSTRSLLGAKPGAAAISAKMSSSKSSTTSTPPPPGRPQPLVDQRYEEFTDGETGTLYYYEQASNRTLWTLPDLPLGMTWERCLVDPRDSSRRAFYSPRASPGQAAGKSKWATYEPE